MENVAKLFEQQSQRCKEQKEQSKAESIEGGILESKHVLHQTQKKIQV